MTFNAVLVWQAKEPTFMAWATSVNVSKLMDDFANVAVVETDSLDEAYRLTNTIDQPWWLNGGVHFNGSPDHGMKGCRSTSVGDIMSVKDENAQTHFFIVASCGFKELTQV